jgi:hypothetical protein
MSPLASDRDGHALAARYEALRHDVLGSGVRRHTVHGLALLMRRGMAGWMESVAEEPMRDAATPAALSAMRMPEGIERNLVDIVASMAFATALESRNMTSDSQSKVQTRHLKRNAYVYIRQSSPRQVLENIESTKRQYDLRQRAIALGWRVDQVIIDKDQGHSGKFSTDREGFQRLVTEVSLHRAGIVMGLEVSRLARNSSDWHRLLEICALTDTLVLDDDGLYDPTNFNDRLLLA